MKLSRQNYFSILARWQWALLALLLLPAGVVTSAEVPGRWLFVFELSPAMEKRLPATAEVLQNLLANEGRVHLQEGDSIGVWTCGPTLGAGQFPLTTWRAAQATALTSNLLDFLQTQKYTSAARLAVLAPTLDGVVADSPRLTVVIFCAGENPVSGTTYDTGINLTLQEGRAERKKKSQPFVVVMRSLAGKYIGCTVSFPPSAINLPPFPLPPAPPSNPPPVRVAAPTKPVSAPVVPSLVIVGTKVSGALAEPPASAPAAVSPPPVEPPKLMEVPAPALAPVAAAPVAPVKSLILQGPAPVPVKVAPPLPPPPTNSPAAATEKTDRESRRLIYIAVGLFVVVVIVGVVIFRAGRRPQTSLITSSMQDDPRRK